MFKQAFLAIGAVVGLLGAATLAGDETAQHDFGCKEIACCDPCCANDCDWFLFPQNRRTRVYGWLDAGFLLNSDPAPSRYHGPYNQIDRNEGGLNQAYLVAERELICDAGLDIGGRVDIMYGTDFFLAESKGLEKNPDGTASWNGDYYGLAIPQAYAELGNKTLSMKLGHFYTPIGYEGVPATGNFFYSKSHSYMFAGPFTHWGGIATWNPGSRLSVDAGVVNGWDTLDRETDRAAFLGRLTYKDVCDRWSLSFGIISGDEDTGMQAGYTNQTRYSFIAKVRPTQRLEYVFHQWLGVQEDVFGPGQDSEWYGIDQYLYYDLTCNLRAGARFEWFRDDDGVRLGLSRPANPNDASYVGNLYSLSFGLNWTPLRNIMIRPEVRWDSFDGAGQPFDDGNDDSQFLMGLDAILTF